MALYLMVFGSLLLAVISLMIWAVCRGEFREHEAAKFRVLDLDRETGVKFDD